MSPMRLHVLLLLLGVLHLAVGAIDWEPSTTFTYPYSFRHYPRSLITGKPQESRVECSMVGSSVDACVYDTVCWTKSTDMVLIGEPHKDYGKKLHANWWRDAKTLFTTKLGPSKLIVAKPRVRPYGYYVRSAVVMTPEELRDLDRQKKVLWTPKDKVVHVPAVQGRLSNIWFAGARLAPMFTTQMYGEMLGIPPLTPGQSVVMLPNAGIERVWTSSWHAGVINASIPEGVDILYGDHPTFNGLHASQDSDHELVCAKRAVLYGASPYMFGDWNAAHAFRMAVYTQLGLEHPIAPPLTITILDRKPGAPRRFANLDEVIELCRKYGQEPEVVVWHQVPFEEQVRAMAGTGVFISLHGAGLANEVFLPPGAAVIEVFPVHVKHVLYESIAGFSGLHHFRVFATEQSDSFLPKHQAYYDSGCDKLPTMTMPEEVSCWQHLKDSHIKAPIPDLETALVNALDFVSSEEPVYKR